MPTDLGEYLGQQRRGIHFWTVGLLSKQISAALGTLIYPDEENQLL